MTRSEQLERDAERARIQISTTLDELRGRMSPGQVVDQIVDYMRDGNGATFVRNFRRQVVNNPVPVTLVGAGLAWLAMASRRPPDGGGHAWGAGEMATDAGRGLRDKVAAATGQWTDSAGESAHEMHQGLRDTAATAAARLGARAGKTGARVQDTAASAASAVNDAASTAYDAAAAGGRNLMDLFQDQPLILAGVGLALGALLGASVPVTEAEDRLMGEASDATKREAGDFAEHQLDKGKAVGQEALNAASRALDQQHDEHRRAEEDVHEQIREGAEARTGAPTEGEAGREAPLVPSHDSGVMEPDSHGADGERERE